ncbi:MAG: histidine phosphatase family protein [Chloroflexota bacterium]|nr:histidine phosphatase family protein [Chloroflexota bacterium]
MQLLLVRHGQSEPNTTTPDWDLSARGEWEARRAGRRLVDAGVTHILSSPLLRALSTTHIIAEELDHRPVEVWPELREGFDKDYQGGGRAELLSRFPRVTLPAGMPDDGWSYAGDTPELFAARCGRILAMLKTRFGTDDRVLIVTHGGFANYLLHAILCIPPGTPVWFEMANGALTVIRFVPVRERVEWPLYPAFEAEILGVNDTTHLSSP